jgi:aldehyde dehydrogenase (NAD+)
MIALVCGDVVVWKPSEKTPLCAVACHLLLENVLRENAVPEGVCNLVTGNYTIGEWLTSDERVPLVSATGSTRMGKIVATKMAARLGRTILELGGNNAIIVTPSADLNLVLTGALFGAVGTAGQRCTSTRRLIVHESKFDAVKEKLTRAYAQLRIGNPLDSNIHVGPLIDKDAVANYLEAIRQISLQGGTLLVEGGVLSGDAYASGCYVKPCIAVAHPDMEVVKKETFAPILYLMSYKTIEEAIAIQNKVPQGLSSAIMTNDLRESELFLSANGSDCGIANVNIGTSGAEIGGAFGGEKETGGGRESGSDAWKAYMRRQTNTINYGKTLPLAQGIQFDL